MSAVHRRRIVFALGASLIAPRVILAQQHRAQGHLIGIMHHGARAASERELSVLREALRERGFVEGGNLRIEYRFADYDYRRLDHFAREFVRANVQLIFAPTPWPVYAAAAATRSIPIVFSGVNDPVHIKIVKSLARPGANITGVSEASGELTAKRVELMRELFPGSEGFGVVYDEDSAKACYLELNEIGSAGRQLGIEVRRFAYTEKGSLEDAFGKARNANIRALLVPTTYETRRYGEELASHSSASRIPLIHSSSTPVDAGGLMSYGPVTDWGLRRAGDYIARILNGAKPSDLPVERPTRYELVINLKTARAMGITIPRSILLRADRVIE